MRRFFSALILAAIVAPCSASAQSSVDLSTLPSDIKALKWQAVDVAGLSPLKRCQSLLLLNEVLDEMGAQLAAEADVMSAYIDDKQMGSAFASQAPVGGPPPLTFDNAQKIAAALLQGPMTQSPYATQLTGSTDDVLKAYETMYISTCQSKWSSALNNKLRVRAMAHFLEAQGKMADFQAWAPGEIQRQAQQQAAETAARQAAQQQQQQQQQEQQQQRREQAESQQQQREIQRQQQQLQQQEQAAHQMQQAMAMAQQQQNQAAAAANANAAANDGYSDCYYGGSGIVAPAAWYRDGAYLGNAAVRTDARMNAWHAGGAGGGGRRR